MDCAILATMNLRLKDISIISPSYPLHPIISLVPPEIWMIIFLYSDIPTLQTLVSLSPLFCDLIIHPFMMRAYCRERTRYVQVDQHSFFHDLDGIKCGSAQERGKNGIYVDNKREGLWRAYNTNGELFSHITYSNGLRHGYFARFHNINTSTLAEEGSYVNGKKSGLWTSFYVYGGKSDEMLYMDDKLHGYTRGYYPGGEVRYDGSYVKSKKCGLWRRFHLDCVICEEGHYSDDIPVNTWRYYYRNGSLEREGCYSPSSRLPLKRAGMWSFYHENGNIRKVGPYRWGKKEGLWKFYHQDGYPISQILYEKGHMEEKMICRTPSMVAD